MQLRVVSMPSPLNSLIVGIGALCGLLYMAGPELTRFATSSPHAAPPTTATTPAQPSRPALPAAPVALAGARTQLLADARGHFMAPVQIDGMIIETMVDTGASMVAISFEDARRVGINPAPSSPKGYANTANGMVKYSVARIREMRLNGIVVYDVEAAVMPQGAMQGTLLGMSFLKKLSKVEMGNGVLTLAQ
jgi:aspartyl protease family protein